MSVASRVIVGVLFCLVGTPVPSDAQATIAPSVPSGPSRQTLMSIDVPPKVSAPFSATVVTEWTRPLPDGTTMTLRNHRLIARDGEGRVFQERRTLTADGDKVETPLTALEYVDPTQHERYNCNPAVRGCFGSFYNRIVFDSPAEAAIDGKVHDGEVKREDLGRKTIENLEAAGSREVLTIDRGSANLYADSKLTVKEFWFSPQLDINLVTERFWAHGGSEKFWVENIDLGEPDSRLFQLPADYTVRRIGDGSRVSSPVSVLLASALQAWKVLLPLAWRTLLWMTIVLGSALVAIILYALFGRRVRQG